jgi:predicted RNase H-like nuclease (RuvC/YqgF family)
MNHFDPKTQPQPRVDPTLAADRSGTTDAHSRREGDADGVALAVMQNLAQKIDDKGDRIDALEAENADLRERNEELETRLERVEAELGINTTADRQGVADD